MVLYNHPDHCSELNKQNRRKNVYDEYTCKQQLFDQM
jgi:hypothetical protein